MTHAVLVISDHAGDSSALRQALAFPTGHPFAVILVRSLSAALSRLAAAPVDIILLALQLPDSEGMASFDQVQAAAPSTPIVVLCATPDESEAMAAVQRGAQGFFSIEHLHNGLMAQALRSMICRKGVEEALHLEKEKCRILLEAIGEAVLGTDLHGRIVYLNHVAEAMTGWLCGDCTGRPIAEVAPLIDTSTHAPVWDAMLRKICSDEPVQAASGLMLRRRDGHERPVDLTIGPVHERNGALSGTVIVLHDATEAQAANYKKLTYLAEHDFLTGLPNRLLLNDRISQAIVHARRSGMGLAVLFLDLDNFKHLNDSLGHAVGDKLLQSVARCLSDCVRTSDTVSRQGGDEFIIVVLDESDPADVARTAEKILAGIAGAHVIDNHLLHVSTSIGISVYPQDGKDPDTLIKNADTAMYCAKNAGRNSYQFFDREMNVRAVERQIIEAHLRQALRHGEFMLYYQPKVDLISFRITGAEALLRWRHGMRGLVLPAYFVPIAEDCGLIGAVGHWVLREACRQARTWQDAGLSFGPIAVNVSASEFRSRSFLDGVREVLAETGVHPSALELELTESVLMQDAPGSQATLHALKDLGIVLSVDDFGTGYSSLSYLKQFPIDVLKIDQSFVLDMRPESDNGIIVSAVVGMGRSLGLRVIAEGVETQEQCQFLRAHDCNEAQGYFFSQPLAVPEFSQLAARGIAPL